MREPDDAVSGLTTAKVEIRVHGIGDYGFFHALGDPVVAPAYPGRPVTAEENDLVEVANAPYLPRHRVRLVNWSRANRRNTRKIAWYFAFSFTLLNMAGAMYPRPGRRTAWLTVPLHITALLLTAGAVAWGAVLLETVVSFFPPNILVGDGGAISIGLSAGLLSVIMIGRVVAARRRRTATSDAVTWKLAAAHVICAAATAVLLATVRPGSWHYAGWPSYSSARTGDRRFDAMPAFVVATVLVVLLLSALLVIAGAVAARTDPAARTPLASAGAVMVAAVIVQHAVLGLIRASLEIFVSFCTQLFSGNSFQRPHRPDLLLVIYDDGSTLTDNRLDFLPLHGMSFLLVLVVGLLISARQRYGPGLLSLLRWQRDGAVWLHKAIEGMPQLVPAVLPLAGTASLLISAAAIWFLESTRNEFLLAVLMLLVSFLGTAAVLTFIAKQLDPVRELVGRIGDIAGFWPVLDHPLAGASYRGPVISGIQEEIDAHAGAGRHVVLVGHSQGSVVCAWLLSREESSPARRAVDFVTCGSPLKSLYLTFFPGQFGGGFFTDVRDGSATWRNFWRPTDPVGTAVPVADNTELPDPENGGPLRGHGNYWIDRRQERYIAALPPRDPH